MATNHKYISRKMKNGRYVYIYPKDEVTLKPGDIGYRGDGSEAYTTSESSVKLQTKIYNLKKKIKAAAEKARKAYAAAKAKLASAKDTKTYKRLKSAAQKAKTAFNNFKKRYKTASSLEKKVTQMGGGHSGSTNKSTAKNLTNFDIPDIRMELDSELRKKKKQAAANKEKNQTKSGYNTNPNKKNSSSKSQSLK